MLFDNGCVELHLNSNGRDFVVGDVHGHKSLLESLLAAVDFDAGCDRLIVLGDLIDRGPESAAMLRMVRDAPWMVSLMGNHEVMLIDALGDGGSEQLWRMNGGGWASDREEMRECAAIAKRLPLALEWPLPDGSRIGAVHAQTPTGWDWPAVREYALSADHRTANTLVWGRSRAAADAYMRSMPAEDARERFRVWAWEAAQTVSGIDRIYTGHTVIEPPIPRGRGNVVFLETGALQKTGRMSLVDLASGYYWQAGRGDAGVIGPERLPDPDPPGESWRPDAAMLERWSCVE